MGARCGVSLLAVCGVDWSLNFAKLKPSAIEGTRMSDEGRKNLRMPDDDEVFAVVTNMLGANRVKVRCMDGVERTARIPGKMQKRIWIREDDVVLVSPWDWQDEKADITWRYEKQDADQLRDEGHIQD
jgi:translation initiation factor 1A